MKYLPETAVQDAIRRLENQAAVNKAMSCDETQSESLSHFYHGKASAQREAAHEIAKLLESSQ